MGNAQTFLERLRAERERRLAKNKEAVSGESREFLLTENLPEGNKLWWPSEDTEVTMHILPFMVGKKDNIAEEEVGHFAIVRKVKIHFLPNRAVKVCPETYGHTCPLCESIARMPKTSVARRAARPRSTRQRNSPFSTRFSKFRARTERIVSRFGLCAEVLSPGGKAL